MNPADIAPNPTTPEAAAETSGTPQGRDDQAADDPRGDDEVRRELGPGDGDDSPPGTGDEPSPR